MTKIIKKKEKGNNRNWKNFKDSQYLGSHNLEQGEEMLLTIVKFEGEEMVQKTDGKAEAKMVLYFEEDVPKMILNITNATTIANLYGQHPEQWFGKKVQLFATPVKAFGKTQDALRVRDFIPNKGADVAGVSAKLKGAKTKAELKTAWEALSTSEKNNPDLIDLKDHLKTTLA